MQRSSGYDWPAFGGLGLDPALDIPCGAAVLEAGEGSGEPRWQEVQGLDPVAEGIASDLRLAAEDAPAPGFAWRACDSRYIAVHFGPRRGDSGGQTEPRLRKQILSCRRDGTLPGALAALALFPELARAAADPAAVLPDLIRLEAAGLSERIGRGIDQLFAAVTEPELTEIYCALLAGEDLVILCDRARSLAAEAVAALLLPLDRARADALSIAGWIPARSVESLDVAQRWDLVFCGQIPRPQTLVAQAARDRHRERAHRMVEALAARDPGVLGTAASTAAATPMGSAGGAKGLPVPEVRVVVWGLSGSGKTMLLMQLLAAKGDHGPGGHWMVQLNAEGDEQVKAIRQEVNLKNRFPDATPATVERYECQVTHRERREWTTRMIIEDRPGDDYADRIRSPDLGEALDRAHGFMLLLDPEGDRNLEDACLHQIVTRLYGAGAKNPRRPLAVCLSKSDRLLHTVQDIRQARQEPHAFARRKLEERHRDCMNLIEQHAEWVQYFPVSATGVHVQCGLLLPTVILDDRRKRRPLLHETTLNIEGPFEWILDRLTA